MGVDHPARPPDPLGALLSPMDQDETGRTEALVVKVYEILRGVAVQFDDLPVLPGTPLPPSAASRALAICVNAAGEVRRLLLEHARAHRAKTVGWPFGVGVHPTHILDLAASPLAHAALTLEEDLANLQRHSVVTGEVVHLRLYAGLTIDQVAAAKGLAPADANDHWRYGRAWLWLHLRPGSTVNNDRTSSDPARLKQAFLEALASSNPDRQARIAMAAGEDTALRADVADLLAATEDADRQGFFSDPAVHFTADTLDRERAGPGTRRTMQHEGPGTVIGPYRLLRLLGQGGFGAVFQARQDRPVRRRVALKIIKSGMDTRAVIARFEQERQALAIMDHPNIAKILDAGSTQTGRPYFVMELVSGQPLTRYCDAKQLTIKQRLELFANVCMAVQHAHARGIIHRDIKPGNVLVAEVDGKPVPKVIDFGIAKATAGGLTDQTFITAGQPFIGTPAYMSPEQADQFDADVDIRTDVYSLGVLLYELVTGVASIDLDRLRRAGLEEMLRIIREEDALRPSVRLAALAKIKADDGAPALDAIAARRDTPPASLIREVRGELDWIVMKAIAKNRDLRYQTANGLAADIHRYLKGDPIAAAPPDAIYALRKMVKRHRVLFGGAAAVAAALVLGLGLATWAYIAASHERDQKELARRQADDSRAESDEISGFLVNMIGSPSPFKRGSEVKVTDILDDAVHRLDAGAFKSRPALESRIRGTLGRTYASLYIEDHGRTQLTRAAELARTALAAAPKDPKLQRLNIESIIALGEFNYRETVGRYRESAELGRRAYDESLAAFGAADPLTWSAANCYGTAQGLCGHPELADDLFESIIQSRIRAVGIDQLVRDQGLSTMADNLATFYAQHGKFDKAIDLSTRLIAAYATASGPDHPAATWTRMQLGATYLAVGRFQDAVDIERQVIPIWKAKGGKGSVYVLYATCYLVDGLHQLNRTQEADAAISELSAIAEASTIPQEVRVDADAWRGVWAYERGDLAAAEQFTRRALTFLESNRSESDWARQEMNVLMAAIDLDSGRPQDALRRSRAAVAIVGTRFGANTAGYAGPYNTHAAALAATGDFDRADPFMQASTDTLLKTCGPASPRTRIALRRAVAMYQAWARDARDPAVVQRAQEQQLRFQKLLDGGGT